MNKETATILRSMLYAAKSAKTLEGAIIALEAMCDEETIAYAEKKVMEAKAADANKKPPSN